MLMVQRGPGWQMEQGQMGERTRRGTVPVRSPLVAGGRHPTRTGEKGPLLALVPGKDTPRSESNKVVGAVILSALPLCWAHCLPLQTAFFHTAEHTQRHRYTETETLVTTHMRLSGGLPWPCPGLVGIGAGATSGRKARSLVWGRLAGIDSGASPPQTGCFLCPSSGWEPAPPCAFRFYPCGHTSDSRTAGLPCSSGKQGGYVPWERNSHSAVFLFRQHTSSTMVSVYSILEHRN